MLEIIGAEKCNLMKEEILRAFAASARLASSMGWDVPSYVLLVVAGSESEYRELVEKGFVELEEGLLVKDGVAVAVLGELLPNVLLDKLFTGFLAVSYCETFKQLSPEVPRELVREKYMELLTSVYGERT